MKRFLFIQCFFLVTLFTATAQNKPFVPIFNETIKGDMIVVGNSILNIGNYPANSAYTGSHAHNARITLNYADIDNDTSTFNSSSAVVVEPASTCTKKVKKAYLYWSAAYTEERVKYQTNPKLERSKFKNVKFKVGNGAYHDLVGTAVFDDNVVLSSTGYGGADKGQKAYVYRTEVTNLLSGIGNTYTVANIQAPNGYEDSGVGYAAGWTLVIVYEDPARESRNVTLFDGFSVVKSGVSPNIRISGFKTVPSGPVRAKIGFAALEGELGITGDQLWINGKQLTSVPARDGNNFFNSKITNEAGANINRSPASTNLLGFDAGIFNLPNNNKDILANGATSATINPRTVQDSYYPFFFAFNVEVIAPHVVMDKRVFNATNQDITNATTVKLGDQIRYRIRFKNIGNDDAKDLKIVDKLPQGLDAQTSAYTVPAGFPAPTFNPADRTVTFTVPNSYVKKGSAEQQVAITIKVLSDCAQFRDPCSNIVANSATASYNGVENPQTTPYKTQSFNTEFANNNCGGGTEGDTTFKIDYDFSKCAYKETIELCQPTATLSAAAGFTTYKWTKDGDASFNHSGQTLTVSEPGVYKVVKSKTGCSTMYEEYTIVANQNDANHPVENKITTKLISGEIYTCPSDGKKYPQVYLCGKNAVVTIPVNIATAKNYVWEKINGTRTGDIKCPPTNPSWTPIHTNTGRQSQLTINEAGEYRLNITFDGDCVSTYYFRVTKNELDAKIEYTDIVCTTKGKITVKNVPATGYQFALMQGTTVVKNYQASNEFLVATPGIYKVLIKQNITQAGVIPCVYEFTNISIQKREPKLTVTTANPTCSGARGSMFIQLSDPPYNPFTYVVRKNNSAGEVIVSYTSSGTTTNTTNVNFTNYFNAGTYFVEVKNNYGCNISKGGIVITAPKELKAEATVLKPIMDCQPGVIRVKASGGTKGNSYAFIDSNLTTYYNHSADYYDFTVTTPGNYQYTVTDANGCNTVTTFVRIDRLQPPTAPNPTVKLYDCGAKAKVVFAEPVSTVSYTYEYRLDSSHPYQSGREIEVNPGDIYVSVSMRYTYNGTTSCELLFSDMSIPTYGASNLIASARVAQLVGCGDNIGETGKALVQFTNVQGGQQPYMYNFGDGNWTTTSQMWLPPGDYNLSVKDAIECMRQGLKVKVQDRILFLVLQIYFTIVKERVQ